MDRNTWLNYIQSLRDLLTLDPKMQFVSERVGKNIFHANSNQKRTGLAIQMSHKIVYKSKIFIKNKRLHMLIKESTHVKDVAIVNISYQTTELQNI